MRPRVVALVVTYWKSRLSNVERIVKDLQQGTIDPDLIIVLNNNPETVLDIDGAVVINSQYNFRSRGKLVACLMHVADYYLLLDDDTSVSPTTLENFMETAHRKSCHAYCGIEFGGGNGNRVFPYDIKEETAVEYFLGCGMFISFYCLVRSLILDEKLRIHTKWKHQAEDITVGLANHATILPMPEVEGFVDLSWGTEAMAYGSDGTSEGSIDYLKMRARVKEYAKGLLKEDGIPEWS